MHWATCQWRCDLNKKLLMHAYSWKVDQHIFKSKTTSNKREPNSYYSSYYSNMTVLVVIIAMNYLVPHAKQATQCPHGRKKQSLGASKQIAQRRRVLLLVSPSPESFPSMGPPGRKSRSSSSCGKESYDKRQLERSSSLWESRGALWGSVPPVLTTVLSSWAHWSLFNKLKVQNTSKVNPPAGRCSINSKIKPFKIGIGCKRLT